jgi:hypothetical protein
VRALRRSLAGLRLQKRAKEKSTRNPPRHERKRVAWAEDATVPQWIPEHHVIQLGHVHAGRTRYVTCPVETVSNADLDVALQAG